MNRAKVAVTFDLSVGGKPVPGKYVAAPRQTTTFTLPVGQMTFSHCAGRAMQFFGKKALVANGEYRMTCEDWQNKYDQDDATCDGP